MLVLELEVVRMYVENGFRKKLEKLVDLGLSREKAIYFFYTEEEANSNEVFLSEFSPMDWAFIVGKFPNNESVVNLCEKNIKDYNEDGGSDSGWRKNSDTKNWYKVWNFLRNKEKICSDAAFERLKNSKGDADSWIYVIREEANSLRSCKNFELYQEKFGLVSSLEDAVRIYRSYNTIPTGILFPVMVGGHPGDYFVRCATRKVIEWHVNNSSLSIDQLKSIPYNICRQEVAGKIEELQG